MEFLSEEEIRATLRNMYEALLNKNVEAMLDLLRQDDPRKFEDIHKRAIDYYHEQEGTIARAEEIYHRLWLGQKPEVQKKLWPEIGAHLGSNIKELPVEAQT